MITGLSGRRLRRAGIAVASCIAIGLSRDSAAQETDSTRASDDTNPLVIRSASPSRVVIQSGAGTAAGKALSRVLRAPYAVIDGRGRAIDLPRGAAFDSSLVVISPRVTVGANVSGDVVVIGGGLYLHPGAVIGGSAIAIGGGVYKSTLATARSRQSFRDETFDVAYEGDAALLSHRVTRVEGSTEVVSWPFGIGLRLPSYNRIDGMTLPWGPYLSLFRGRFEIDPTVTYRSDLGNVEPGLGATLSFGRMEARLDARRSTFSNDKWIRGDLVNSLTTLAAGRDARNYFRADRAELTLGGNWIAGALDLDAYIGSLDELGWSSGAELSADSHPFSIFGKDSVDGIYRPNPAADRGRIKSAVAGLRMGWIFGDVETRADARYERAWKEPRGILTLVSPPCFVCALTPPDFIPVRPVRPGDFDQLTLDAAIRFPTFGDQRLETRSHYVTSWGEGLPPHQRWVYLGGGGTIPTMDLLEQGGTELFFFESNYIVPVRAFQLPFVGSPIVTFRYMTGAAGVDELPRFTQNMGVRVGVRFVGAEFLMDPDSKEKQFGIGFSLSP